MKFQVKTIRVVKDWDYDEGDKTPNGYLVVGDDYDGDENQEYYAHVWSRQLAIAAAKAIGKIERLKFKTTSR